MSGHFTRATAEATKAPSVSRFAWHDVGAVSALAAQTTGSTPTFLTDGEITFTASSPEDYLRRYEELHPTSQEQRPILERAGTYDAIRAKVLEDLKTSNEAPDGFAVTSRYRVIQFQH